MKTLVLAAFLGALALAGTALAAKKPLVPVYVQHLIAKRAPAVAYVPARGAIGFPYRNFKIRHGVLHIWFPSRTEPSKTIVFSARAFHGTCRAGASKSFQMAGVKTWYGYDGTTQRAWRCLHGRKLTASTTMGLRRFADAGLARMAASGHRIRY
ncbi:MAG TPA: hypothetical protein VFJ77_02250 [Gaiellaceae bacterium]|nr:hypothetical protein [Gaiellaceae bacterium]